MLSAVIVTYNRKELLGINIKSILDQTVHFDAIFIIDNCSTDGTYEYLKSEGWLDQELFKYIKTDSNIGGAGGFCVGVEAAFKAGSDWIVLMDDDGKAKNEQTFQILFDAADKFYKEGRCNRKLFVNSLVQQGDLLSFKIGNIYTVADAVKASQNGILEGVVHPFNGTLISRELVSEIGYPNKDFFIKGDEVDFKQRALDVGAYVVTVVESRYIHPMPKTQERKVLGISVPFFVEAPWKEYYAARNFTYMYKKKGLYKAIAFELIFVKILAVFSMQCRKIETIKMVLKGVCDGWKEKLGPTVTP